LWSFLAGFEDDVLDFDGGVASHVLKSVPVMQEDSST
jgi:hypothetical protein